MSSAENSTAARKRLRSDKEEAESSATPSIETVRSPDFYFADGSIVLKTISEDKRVQTLFRVHKSLLAMHCNVFRGMFGEDDAAHFAGVSEQVDGVPLMQLHDGAEDVEDFLRALYKPEFMQRHLEPHKHGLTRNDFPKMYRRTMRLAKKYEAEQLCALFASAMREAWPAEWGSQEKVWRDRRENSLLYDDIQKYNPSRPHPAWSIRMARDHGIPEVLPYAFYDFYTYVAPSSLKVNADGEAVNADGDDYPMATYQVEKDISLLNPDEMACLLFGGSRLSSYVHSHVAKTPAPETGRFTHPPGSGYHCYENIRATWKLLKASLQAPEGIYEPFGDLWHTMDEGSICQTCAKPLRDKLDGMGEDVWAKLPSFFDLSRYADNNVHV